jgi:hypothetical protein
MRPQPGLILKREPLTPPVRSAAWKVATGELDAAVTRDGRHDTDERHRSSTLRCELVDGRLECVAVLS